MELQVVLADEQKEVLSALRLSLGVRHRNWEFLTLTSLTGLCRILESGCPDLLIVDWGMRGLLETDPLPNIRWENVLAAVRRRCPHLGIIVLDNDPETARLALESGANDFVCKTDPPETILTTIDRWIERTSQSR